MKTHRLPIACLLGFTYVVLFWVNFYYDQRTIMNASALLLLQFGFSMAVAFLFISVGVLVWLFAYKRKIASLVLGFCTAMMVIFQIELAALHNSPFFSLLSNASSTIAIMIFSVLVVFFPKDYFAYPVVSRKIALLFLSKHSFLRWYLTIDVLVGSLLALCVPLVSILHLKIEYLRNIEIYYYVLCISCSFLFLLASRHTLKTRRDRQQEQQWRMLIVGIALSITPFLVLTLVPALVHLTTLQVGSQISTISMVFLPISLGYGLLRYQLTLPDSSIRHVTAGIVNVLGLIILGYSILISTQTVLLHQYGIARIVEVDALTVFLSPLIWYGSRRVAHWSFLQEYLSERFSKLQLRESMQKQHLVKNDEIADALTITLGSLFETFEIGVFVLSHERGTYALTPYVEGSHELFDDGRHQLLQMLRACELVGPSFGQEIARTHSIVRYLCHQRRPVFLHEFQANRSGGSAVHSRHFLLSDSVTESPLLVPLFSGNTDPDLIAVIAIGRLEHERMFTGPDFWDLPWFVAPYIQSFALTIRQELDSYDAALLEVIYAGATTHERLVSSAAQFCARAELWNIHPLSLDASAGAGPSLSFRKGVASSDTWRNWRPYFYVAEEGHPLPGHDQNPILSSVLVGDVPPPYSFALLPLQSSILVLTYSSPHIFSQKEKKLLSAFASNYATTMLLRENTQLFEATRHSEESLSDFQERYRKYVRQEFALSLQSLHDVLHLLKSGYLQSDRKEHALQKAKSLVYLLYLLDGSHKAFMSTSMDMPLELTSVQVTSALHFTASLFEDTFRQEDRQFVSSLSPNVRVLASEESLRQLFVLVFRLACSLPMGSALTVSSSQDEETVSLCFAVHSTNIIFPRFSQESPKEREENHEVLVSLITFLTRQLQGTFRADSSSNAHVSAFMLVLKRGQERKHELALHSQDWNFAQQ